MDADRTGRPPHAPAALLFDVFGTCVDWRSRVIREGEALGGRLGLGEVDWPALADAWRGQYQPRMETVRSGERPWATLDVLHRLGGRFTVAPCSNGHIALLVDLSRHAGITWDAILGAEIARTYKPRPEVYTRSVETLGLRPGQVMMVAEDAADPPAIEPGRLRCESLSRPTWRARPG
jgi:2-haloacid dehalogenase